MFQVLYWAWAPYLFNKAHRCVTRLRRLTEVVYAELLVKKEWIFFKNAGIPVNSENFGSIENTNVKWRCEVCPPRFTDPSYVSTEEPRHLSYLSFVVKLGEKEIDLSNWINDVHYSGFEEPTVGEIFALWCCETGTSYFHGLDTMEVEYITQMGDVVRTKI